MNASPESLAELAAAVARTEEKLQELEKEVQSVGEPAGSDLRKRVEALRVEEAALKRNLHEAFGTGEVDEKRMAKIEALLEHIESEERHIHHETDFRDRAVPNSSEIIVKMGDRSVKLVLGAIKRLLGDHHPLGTSVFVNHTHETLARRYGVSATDDVPADERKHSP